MELEKVITMEQYLDEIDSEYTDSEFDTCMAIFESYVKAYEIMSNGGNYEIASTISIFQEAKTTTAEEPPKESIIKKILLFLPRLIAVVVKKIKNAFSNNKPDTDSDGKIKMSNKELEEISKADATKNVVKKLIVGAGIATSVTALGVFTCQIIDYSPAVEFKDDVKFAIAETGELRIVFPYYKIDQIKEFNKNIDKPINEFKNVIKQTNVDRNATLNASRAISKVFNKVFTNQALIRERSYKDINEWDAFYKEITEIFKAYSEKLNSISELAKSISGDVKTTIMTPSSASDDRGISHIDDSGFSWIKDLETFIKKTPGDTELITKLNEKIHKVHGILTNPNGSKIKKALNSKYKFEPITDQSEIVDMYKIDKSHILKAINYLNEMAETFKNDSDIKNGKRNKDLYKTMMDTAQYKNAMHELEMQFNCKIVDKYTTGGGSTEPWSGKKGSGVTFDKNKGFNLNGMEMHINNDPVDWVMESGKDGVAGQYGVSVICHEIFHNIAHWCNIIYGKIETAIRNLIVVECKVYEMIEKIVKTIMGIVHGTYNLTKEQEDKIAYLCENSSTEAECKDAIDTVTDEKKWVAIREKPRRKRDMVLRIAASVGPVFAAGIVAIMYSKQSLLAGGIYAILALMSASILGLFRHRGTQTPEETMCDLFAAIYHLPVIFNGKYVNNLPEDVNRHKNKKLRHAMDVHMATYDRNTMSYGLAKEILNSGEPIPPEIKKYLEYIVDKNEKYARTERRFTKGDMKEMPAVPELNDYVSNFIKKHNIKITE